MWSLEICFGYLKSRTLLNAPFQVICAEKPHLCPWLLEDESKTDNSRQNKDGDANESET